MSARRHRLLAWGLGLALVAGAGACSGALQESSWGLDAINEMATPTDPAATCNVPLPTDTLASARAACTFTAGAHPSETLGVSTGVSAAIPIRHVIIAMKENRSYDHLLGNLNHEGQPDSEPVPADFVNLDLKGNAVAPFHLSTTCIPSDPDHQSAAVVSEIAGGAMSGFVKNAALSTETDGHFAMGEYDSSDFPFYYWLANTFALSDRHFAPMQTGTFANRDFMLLGTNAGVIDTGITFPPPSTTSIFQTLMAAGFTWGAYTDGSPFSGALGWDSDDPGVHSFQDLLDALDQGTLPNVVFVDGMDNVQDDHPPADVQVGEAWMKRLYDHAAASPEWRRMAIIWTYDEAGSFADHVPPPSGCQAAPSNSTFTGFGPRVPLVMISPWAKKHYVSHVVHDHTAITRFIETVFDLPALTARDANSDALLDLLDFSCERDLTPPTAPGPGTGGCKP